jgi:hypothetical protein
MFVCSTVFAYSNFYFDSFTTGNWNASSGWQSCAAYSGGRPCISNGSYFSGDGIGSGDVVFAYTTNNISDTLSITSTMRSSTGSNYVAIDMMTGPRNSEQGNKTEYVGIIIIKYSSVGSTIQRYDFSENITNTTMETFAYDIGSLANTYNIGIIISGRDGGYWAGNYGAVIGAGSLYITDSDPTNTGPETTTTTGTSSGPTSTQATIKSSAETRRDSYSGDDNGIYIDQAGSNNSITILQDSDNNQIRGIDQQNAQLWGNSNTYDIRQGAPTTTGINLIELMVDGDSNDLTLFQDRFDAGTADSSASGDNILRIDIDGNSNTVATNQRGETNAGGQFGEINITGNLNDVTMVQRSTLSETAFIDITGNSNVVDLLQQNTSNAVGSTKFAEIKLTGDGHTVNLTQDGTGGHQATIDLTYGSAPSTLNLNQLGSTSQSFSLEQTCYTSGGCSTTLTQQ